MSVGVVGSGSAADAVLAALTDTDASAVETAADALEDTDFAVVAGRTGTSVFETASRTARAVGVPWLAVELGGVGGYPVVDAAVSGFAPDTGCYDCLSSRVGANVDPETEPAAAPDAATARFAGALAGRRAVAYLDDGDESAFGSVVEVPHAERTFLPVPGCDCGDDPGPALPTEYEERSLEDALARAERALDDRVGLVGEVGEAESYPAPYYLARACDTGGFSDATADRNAAGVDADWNAAFMKALGEGLERYCAGVYRTDAFTTATAEAVDAPIRPSAFVTPDDVEDDPDESLPWVRATDLPTGDAVSVPAEFVHYPPPERRFGPSITTGLGLGNSGVEAVLSGLYEVIERDATMLSWYSTYDPLELTVADDAYRTLARRAGAENLATTALLCTQDVDVPVVAVAVHRDSFPKLALGSAASLDPHAAARTALAEAVQNWVELRGMGPEDAAEASGAIGRYATNPDPFWDAMAAEQTVPAESVGPKEVPSGRAELKEVVERVVDAGPDAYAARTTTRDVERLGFEAVRVLVPSAQPLFFETPYFGERAEVVPWELGFEPRLDRRHHPFP